MPQGNCARQSNRYRGLLSRSGCLITAALFCALAGCGSPDPDRPFYQYLNTLTLAFGPGPSPAAIIAMPPFPSGDSLPLPLPSTPYPGPTQQKRTTTQGGDIDILELSGCDLQSNIVKRQSTLGRHAKGSQRLLLELEYLRLAPDCIGQLRQRGSTALANILEQGWRWRLEQLPHFIYIAILGSDEFRFFWAMERAPLAHPPGNHRETLEGFAQLNEQVRRWLDGDFRANALEFELALGEVARGGDPLRTLTRRGSWLSATHRLIENQLAGDPDCHGVTTRPQIASALAAAKQQFKKELQPLLATTTGHVSELLSGIAQLEQQLLAALPGSYRTWRDNRDLHFQGLRDALLRHPAQLERAATLCKRH